MSESLLPNEVPTVVESNEAQDGANDASDEASSAPNVEATSDSAGSEGEEAEEVCPICGTNCARANGRPCNEQDESSDPSRVTIEPDTPEVPPSRPEISFYDYWRFEQEQSAIPDHIFNACSGF